MILIQLYDEQRKRIFATLFIALIFTYFWVEGAIPQALGIVNLESSQSEFLIPKLVLTTPETEKDKFGLIDTEQEKSPYFGLINKPIALKTFGLIADPNNSPAMVQAVADNMLAHAETFQLASQYSLKTAINQFYLELRNKAGKLVGLYLESTGLTEHIKGYAGPITLGVTVSPEGKLTSLSYISSEETTSYLAKITSHRFYEQFNGLALNGKKHSIDAISGATITTEAIARTVSELLDKASESPLSLYLEEDPSGTIIEAQITSVWIIHTVIVALIFLVFWQRWLKPSRKQRLIIVLFSTFYIGFFLNNSFTYISFLHPFQGVSLSYMVGFYCLFTLLSSIWDNNSYCKFVCPYGNVQRLITKFLPNRRRPFFVPTKWIRYLRSLLTTLIITGVLLGQRSWSSYELFPDLFGLETNSMWFWLSLGLASLTLFYPMIWCRLLCPTGEVLDRLSRLVKPVSKV